MFINRFQLLCLNEEMPQQNYSGRHNEVVSRLYLYVVSL